MLFIFQLRLHWHCHVGVSFFSQLIANFFCRTSWWLFLFFTFILLLTIYIGETLLEINNPLKSYRYLWGWNWMWHPRSQSIEHNSSGRNYIKSYELTSWVDWGYMRFGRLERVSLMCMWSTNSYLCQMLACINFVTVSIYMSTILLPRTREWFL